MCVCLLDVRREGLCFLVAERVGSSMQALLWMSVACVCARLSSRSLPGRHFLQFVCSALMRVRSHCVCVCVCVKMAVLVAALASRIRLREDRASLLRQMLVDHELDRLTCYFDHESTVTRRQTVHTHSTLSRHLPHHTYTIPTYVYRPTDRQDK